MKKKIVTFLLISTLGVSLLAGCGPVDREAQESYRQLGIVQLQEGEYSSAVTSFQKALDESLGRIGQREVDICYYKALAQFKAGQIYAAVETYSSLIEYDDKNADTYYLRGSAYLQCAQAETDETKQSELFDKGIADYNKAASLDEENYKLYIGIYENLIGLGREEYAEEFLSRALNLECSTAQDYCDQGYIYLMLEDYEKAGTLLATAVEKGCDEAMLYQAQLYKLQGDEDQAKSLLETYTAKYPEDVDALYQAGMLSVNAGAYDEAVKILEQAYSLAEKGTNQELQLSLIYAYEYAGQFNDAYELMKEYVKLYPTDLEAAREYEFLKTRTGTSKTPSERAEAEAAKSQETDSDASEATDADTSAEADASDSTDSASDSTDSTSGAEDTAIAIDGDIVEEN